MKRNRVNIFYAWLLLVCFIAGQGAVYIHQHKIIAGSGPRSYHHNASQPRTTVQENCSLCDAMHHTNAVIDQQVYVSPNLITQHFYKAYNYDFVSIALILSAGRAPPVSAPC